MKRPKTRDSVAFSQSQLCRKLHQDLQENAIQEIEERENEKIAHKIKFTISQLKHSPNFQSLAIKFWILIVNLQYYDVKKLTQNFQDRKIA